MPALGPACSGCPSFFSSKNLDAGNHSVRTAPLDERTCRAAVPRQGTFRRQVEVDASNPIVAACYLSDLSCDDGIGKAELTGRKQQYYLEREGPGVKGGVDLTVKKRHATGPDKQKG